MVILPETDRSRMPGTASTGTEIMFPKGEAAGKREITFTREFRRSVKEHGVCKADLKVSWITDTESS